MFRTLLVLVVLCLVLSAFTPAALPPPPAAPAAAALTPAPTPTPTAPAAIPRPPDYSGRGDYRTGVLYAAVGEGDQKVDLAVVYPKLRAKSKLASGPYPLVVFAVGLGGSRYDALLAYLKGDPAAAAALLPANVNFPGVTYKLSAPSAVSAGYALAGNLPAKLGIPHTRAENDGGRCDYPWETESLQFLSGILDF